MKIEDALEKYGYVGVILTQYDFQDEAFMRESFGLIICLLLNSAACVRKNGHFDHVGRICTLILEFDSENVKALFRRAIAAIELGRSDLAYWDLLMAITIDPDNQEVSRKLHQVKNSLSTSSSKNHHHEDTPIGLGIGLSSPLKKAKRSFTRNDGYEQVVSQRNNGKEENSNESAASDHLQSIDDVQDVKDEMEVLDENMDETPKEDRNNIDEDVISHKISNVQENNDTMEIVDEKKDELMKEVTNNSHVNNHNQVESTYQFSNRRRPGSFLSISRINYELLKKGQSIQCFNPNTGSFMMIRVVQVQSSENDITKDMCKHKERQELSSLNLNKKVQKLHPTKIPTTTKMGKITTNKRQV